jgi:Uma2 family endonuclease
MKAALFSRGCSRKAMASTVLESAPRSFAEVLHRLGDIAPERVLLPAGDATEEDVVRLLDGDDKHICELIDGFLVEKIMGLRESILAGIILKYLSAFVAEHDLGLAFGADGLIRLWRGRIRFPDTGFISWGRLPEGELSNEALRHVIPDLSVEVISEGNTREEMEKKLDDYFRAGVKLVWYVYPDDEVAYAYTSPTRKKKVGLDGALDGGKVLPGFSLPLAKVFDEFHRRRRR